MKYLVVFAHPYSKSFNNAIVDTIKEEVINNGAEVEIRDLYNIGFDPVLKGSDLLNLRDKNYANDIRTEQEYVKWADIIIFVYPVWWAGLPAMLKGYVDRVFANGFAFVDGKNGPNGLLNGKKALLISTTGFPSDIYEEIGMHKSMKQTVDQAIFEFCGIEVKNHIFLGGVPTSSRETLVDYLKEVREAIN